MRRGPIIGAVLIAVLVCALFYFFAVRSRQSELSDVKDQIEAAENETAQLQAELTRLQGLQENAPKLEAQLAEIRELVPQRNEVANFIFLVQEAADASGVPFLSIQPELPKPPPEGATLAEIRTVITARGGYFALQDFMRRLYRLDRALRIDSLSLAGGQVEGETAGGAVSLSITARIFFELPEGVAVGTTTTTTGAEPTATPTP